MPAFVRNVSEDMIPKEINFVLEDIIANWIERQLHEIFSVNQNVKFMNSSKYSLQIQLEKFDRLEDNMQYFIQRMKTKYGGEKGANLNPVGMQLGSDSSSDQSAESE